MSKRDEILQAIFTLENPARTYCQCAKIIKDEQGYALEFTNKQLYERYSHYDAEGTKEVIAHIYQETGEFVHFAYRDIVECARQLHSVDNTLTAEDVKDVRKEDIDAIIKLSKLPDEVQNFILCSIYTAYEAIRNEL